MNREEGLGGERYKGSSKEHYFDNASASHGEESVYTEIIKAEERASIKKLSMCRKPPQEETSAQFGIVWSLQANLFTSIIHSKDLSNLQMRIHFVVREALWRAGSCGNREERCERTNIWQGSEGGCRWI